jgi:hypothetical protein
MLLREKGFVRLEEWTDGREATIGVFLYRSGDGDAAQSDE